jgi:uncharacterized protein
LYAFKWWITGITALLFAVVLGTWFGASWWKISLIGIATAIIGLLFPHQPLLIFGVASIGLAIVLITTEGELREWFDSTWGFAKQILPLLLFGVLVAGFLLGRPGNEGVIPSHWISDAVGGNSLWANLFASVAGAFMYFATLTEVPILQGLLGSGMGQGPALALLLAGPALSLPSMLVLNSIMGFKKTFVFVLLVVVMATITGLIYGSFF